MSNIRKNVSPPLRIYKYFGVSPSGSEVIQKHRLHFCSTALTIVNKLFTAEYNAIF